MFSLNFSLSWPMCPGHILTGSLMWDQVYASLMSKEVVFIYSEPQKAVIFMIFGNGPTRSFLETYLYEIIL